jgi:hypothetical protein
MGVRSGCEVTIRRAFTGNASGPASLYRQARVEVRPGLAMYRPQGDV